MKKEYVSHPSVLCGAERFTYSQGKAKGVEAVRMYNGKLELTVLLDRCMDIYRLSWKGMNVSYISKNGIVSPRLTETGAYNFLESFGGGFLYTCGLNNIGSPTETFPQHGSISYIPAENVRIETEDSDGDYRVILKGSMRFSSLFGQNLVMNREITLSYLGNSVNVKDTIVNESFTNAGYMLMYHSNIGYPLLDENARLTIDAQKTERFSDNADLDRWGVFEVPTAGRAEEVFLHTMKQSECVRAVLENGDIRMTLEFSPKDFPYMTQWKSMASGDYVLGIEPVTTPMSVREKNVLAPSESRTHIATWYFE